MATAILIEPDNRVRGAVIRELACDPEVDTMGVGVTARNGTVTLIGFIDTDSAKLAAGRAATRVPGVRAIDNRIVVLPFHAWQRNDEGMGLGDH